jgi:hypothetical protein
MFAIFTLFWVLGHHRCRDGGSDFFLYIIIIIIIIISYFVIIICTVYEFIYSQANQSRHCEAYHAYGVYL